jgi:hypothetical protein
VLLVSDGDHRTVFLKGNRAIGTVEAQGVTTFRARAGGRRTSSPDPVRRSVGAILAFDSAGHSDSGRQGQAALSRVRL